VKRKLAPALLPILLLGVLAPGIAMGASTDRRSGGDRADAVHLPIVIGHRGAAGYRPEHTLASYRLAIELGADFIEPDLVSTKDHVLVARHENDITATTNVADHPEFATRRTTKVVDGTSITGWFTEDFTLAELRTLRAKERLPDVRPQNTAFDGIELVPTFQEVIDLAKLRANGLDRPDAKVFIQSFEVGNLEQLHRMTKVPLIQLLDELGRPFDFVVSGDPRTYKDLAKPAGLAEIATYARGIGPNKNLIVPRDSSNHLQTPTSLVGDAHHAGLLLHPFTFRNENTFLPQDFRQGNPASPEFLRARGDSPAELRLFFGLGVDGLFTDDSDTAVATRTEMFGTR
jgi:glycerophosphoryl diester phosphodiesterase